jgi:hypothetical protein
MQTLRLCPDLPTAACAVSLILCPTTTQSKFPPRADLDGMVFVGELHVLQTGAKLPERIQFTRGLLHSLASDNFGYTDGPYTARRVGQAILFDGFTESPDLGSMIWRGRIIGDELQGRATARDPGVPETHFLVQAFAID